MKIKAVTILAIVLASLTVIGIVLGVALLPDGAEEHVCTYTTIGNTATCEQGGEKTQACSVCGDRRVIPIPALGHDMKYTDEDATCTEDGMHSGMCLRCNYAIFEPRPAFGHNYMISLETSSTCTAGGERVEICLNCNDEKRTPFDPVSHDTVAVAEKAATCLDTGYAAYEYCKNCSYTTRGDDFPALGHEMTFNERDATCTEDGLYEGACSRCDHTVSEPRPAFGHKYVLSREESATCTEGGERVEICERCREERKIQLDPKGHVILNMSAKAATCTENGYDAYEYCKNCSYSTKGTVISAFGHVEKTQVVSSATCVKEGVERVYCARCSFTIRTQTLPKTEHNLKDKTDFQKPTCTEPGYTYYKVCDTCDYSEYEVAPALGHVERTQVVLMPTCAKEGREKVYCARCHFTIRTKTLSKKSHSYKLDSSKQPTCLEDGWELLACAYDCGATVRNVLPSLGHDWQDYHPNTDNPGPGECPLAECSVCSHCGMIQGGGHDWQDYHPNTDNPGIGECPFAEYSVCSHCGLIQGGGHDYVYDYRDIENCNVGGTIYHTCQLCGDEGSGFSYGMPHTLISHSPVFATCTTPGNYGYYTCERCSYNTYEEIPALGHDYDQGYCTRCNEEDYILTLAGTTWLINSDFDASWRCQYYLGEIIIDGSTAYERLYIGWVYDHDSGLWMSDNRIISFSKDDYIEGTAFTIYFPIDVLMDDSMMYKLLDWLRVNGKLVLDIVTPEPL